MLTLDALRSFGADVDAGLERCMNNEAFYLRMVKLETADESFDKLKCALASGDLNAAFEAAHAFKGVLGNLALTPIFRPASEITELLRSRKDAPTGETADLQGYVTVIDEQWQTLLALCKD